VTQTTAELLNPCVAPKPPTHLPKPTSFKAVAHRKEARPTDHVAR
jgi:hypothetical protein